MEKEIVIIGARPYDQVRDLCHRAKAMDVPDFVHAVGYTDNHT